MTSLRCPICRITVHGDGENEITGNLKDHLASAHEISGMCETGQNPMPQGPEPEDWERMKRGAAAGVGEDVEETVLCPFCGSRVFGHDGDDLSKKLHDHIEDIHDLRPARLVARMRF